MELKDIDSIESLKSQIPPVGEYVIDPIHSFAEFAAQHLIVGQVRGRFDKVEGTIAIDNDPFKSRAEFLIDTATINTHHPERDADLRSERFFHVAGYPTIKYSSTEVLLEPNGHLLIKGNITIRGVTRPVSAIVEFLGTTKDPWGNTRIALEGRSKLSRRDFGVSGELEQETGGYPTGRDVRITVAVEAVLKTK